MVPPTQDCGRSVPRGLAGRAAGFCDPGPRRQGESRADSRWEPRPRRGGRAAAGQREPRDLTPFQAAGAARASERLSPNGLVDTARADFRDRDRGQLEPRLRVCAHLLDGGDRGAPAGRTWPAGLAYWVAGAAGSVAFYACLLAHELAHALVATRYGVKVGGITLWLFGGVSRLDGEPKSAGA